MEQYSFPHSAETVVTTLISLFETQKISDVADILRSSQPRIDCVHSDNWNGGTYYYTLTLEIPIRLFGEIEAKLSEIEKAIVGKVENFFRANTTDHLNEVVISPQLTPRSTPLQIAGEDTEAGHLWEPGLMRLFLSHVATYKVAVGELKDELRVYGISAFVAHEDIEPNSVWQNEIWRALQSMQAMVALLTPEFHHSSWTDQEMGFALGRRITVIPVRLGLDPYGFVGIQQALAGTLDDPVDLSSQIVDVLLKQVATTSMMRESLVVGLEQSNSYVCSIAVSAKLAATSDFTGDQLDRLETAYKDNSQVEAAFGVKAIIDRVIGRQRPVIESSGDDLPF